MAIHRTRRYTHRSWTGTSESGSGTGPKVKDLDVFPPLSYPGHQGGSHVSPGERITNGDRNYPTIGRCTSGTMPLPRSDTFSEGARQPKTTKPHPNSDRKPFQGRKNAVCDCFILPHFCFTHRWVFLHFRTEEGRSKQLQRSRPIEKLSPCTPIKLDARRRATTQSALSCRRSQSPRHFSFAVGIQLRCEPNSDTVLFSLIAPRYPLSWRRQGHKRLSGHL